MLTDAQRDGRPAEYRLSVECCWSNRENLCT